MPGTTTPMRVPRHIAIVMDGNGRWAKLRRRPRSFGHRAGQKAVRQVIAGCLRQQVETLTLFAFSSENWGRPPEEIRALMELFLHALDKEVEELHKHGVRLRFIGDLAALDAGLHEKMARASQRTLGNQKLNLNVAINYGGRWDLAQAAQQAALAVQRGELAVEAIDEAQLSEWTCLGGQASVDLLIRTGGEYRISNFLLWQLAYAELYFCDTLWPDFDQAALSQALAAYACRERRYGRTSDQLAYAS